MDHLWMARDIQEFKDAVKNAFAGTDERPARRRTKFNKLLTDEAAKIAKAAECSTILVFTDVFPPTLAPRMTFPGFRVVLAGEDVSDHEKRAPPCSCNSGGAGFIKFETFPASCCDPAWFNSGNFWIPGQSLLCEGIPQSGQLDTVPGG